MSTFRVCWRDSAGIGRFEDIEAPSKEHAAWQVAVDGKPAELDSVSEMTDREEI